MSLDAIVSVDISVVEVNITRVGFGTPLIARYHNVFLDLSREYSSSADMVTDGFAATDPAVVMARRFEAQSPRVRTWKVGRRQSAFTQNIRITPISTTEGFVYDFDVVSPDGTVTNINHVVPGAATVATIVTALAAQLDAIVGLTATDNTTDVTAQADTPGDLFDYLRASQKPDDWSFKDITTDPGIAADLTAIRTADPDWYGLALDSNSEAESLATAAWAEAQLVIFSPNNSDTDIVDSGSSTDLFSDLQAAAYARTVPLYSQAKLLNWSGAAWLGVMLPKDPGSATWAYKTLAGVVVDGSTLTTAHVNTIAAKDGNTYRRIAGLNKTTFGDTSSGSFADIVRGRDWLKVRMQERIFGTISSADKIPYTDAGIAVIETDVKAQLEVGIQQGFLAPTPRPTTSVPAAADVPAADKSARVLRNVTFTATLAGAIHTVEIQGTVTV